MVAIQHRRAPGWWASFRRAGIGAWGFLLYRRFWTRSAARRRVDPAELFGTTPTVALVPRAEGGAEGFRDEDHDLVRSYDVDFILHFGHVPLSADVLSLPRHGIWAFQHGLRGRPPGFWELLEHDDVTVAYLNRLTHDPRAPVVLREGAFAMRKTSYRRSLDAVYFGSAAWPRLVCIDLRHGQAGSVTNATSPARRPERGYPGLGSVAMLALLLVSNRLRQVFGSLFQQRTWSVGIVNAPIHAFLDPGFRPHIRFLNLPLDKHYFADPFGLVEGATTTVLCEAFDYRTWRGCIVAVRVDGAGSASSPIEVLADQYHMSYPFLVEDDGIVYCVPERREAREVALYAAREFPAKWVKVATLLDDVEAVDSTLFVHDGRWWLAYTDSGLGLSDNLCLAYAERLRGPWRRHPGNPVKRDVRSSRPAGTPFLHEGGLYRPAQDASRTYGGRVVINRVTRLSPVAFAEEIVAAVEPDPEGEFPNALHTLAAAGPFTLLDGRRDRRTAPRIGAALGTLRRARERRRTAKLRTAEP